MILNEDTKQKFGYYVEEVKPASNKLVVTKCNDCGLYEDRKRVNIKVPTDTVCKECGKKRIKNRIASMTSEEKEQWLAERKKTNRAKYGADHAWQAESVKEKIKQANIEKFGVANPNQSEEILAKRKATNRKKYGTDHGLSSDEVKAKIKAKNIERFGVENVSHSEEVKAKRKNTFLNKYGKSTPFAAEECREKMKQTNVERYGAEYFSASEYGKKLLKEVQNNKSAEEKQEILDKAIATNLNRYGVSNPMQNKDIKAKAVQASIDKFGVDNPSKNTDVIHKILQTKIDKYGTLAPKFGKTQQEIQDWLNSFGFDFKSDVNILKGKELDLYDSTLNLAIEYCGLYWHNENSPEPRGRNYHYQKYQECLKQGIQLITIFEDEWLFHKEQVKSRLLSLIGKCNRISARLCVIKELTKKEAGQFFDATHIQGSPMKAVLYVGLIYQNEIVGCLSIGKHHRQVEAYTLSRMSFKQNTVIIGGASKLWKYTVNWLKNQNIKFVISWSDNRWSTGNIYPALGFELKSDLLPDYSYVYTNGRDASRFSKQAKTRKALGCGENETELQKANELGLSRIWDCGKKLWYFVV